MGYDCYYIPDRPHGPCCLRDGLVPFHYHNGFLQRADDAVLTDQVTEPFWEIVADAKWVNVDMDMKEALDRHDSGKRDAPFYALKALESVVKIISDEKGWTRGTEKGAASRPPRRTGSWKLAPDAGR